MANSQVKKPEDMTLEELFERERNRPPLTLEESKQQIAAIALAEARCAGDTTSTEEDAKAAATIVNMENAGVT